MEFSNCQCSQIACRLSAVGSAPFTFVRLACPRNLSGRGFGSPDLVTSQKLTGSPTCCALQSTSLTILSLKPARGPPAVGPSDRAGCVSRRRRASIFSM